MRMDMALASHYFLVLADVCLSLEEKKAYAGIAARACARRQPPDGEALAVARRRKAARYPELRRGGPQRLCVLAVEVGGRRCEEAQQLVADFVRLRGLGPGACMPLLPGDIDAIPFAIVLGQAEAALPSRLPLR